MSDGSNPCFLSAGVMMAVVWDGGSRPSQSKTLHILVRNGRSTSKDSLMRNVGTGSSSQLFDGALPIKLRTNCCEHGVNEVKEQSVGLNTGGAEPAVSDRMVSTFCSRKLRKSEAENVDKLVVCLDGSPRIVETDRHSFFGLNSFSPYSPSIRFPWTWKPHACLEEPGSKQACWPDPWFGDNDAPAI